MIPWILVGLMTFAQGELSPDLDQHVVEIRRFTFEEADDRNFDGDPDYWTRRKGPEFPPYVIAKIDRTTGYRSRQSLRFELNGGSAAYYSPILKVNEPMLILRGRVRVEGLRRSAAVITLSLLDEKRRRLRRVVSRPVVGHSNPEALASSSSPAPPTKDAEWLPIEVGPVPLDADIQFIVIGCHILGGDLPDTRGSVWFDDLWLGKLPRMSLALSADQEATASPTPQLSSHFLRPGQSVRVSADVFGTNPQWDYTVRLQLEEEAGRIRTSTNLVLNHPEVEKPGERSQLATWDLGPVENGFYRLRGDLLRGGATIQAQSLTFVVMEPASAPPLRGDFGWSLSNGPRGLSHAQIGNLAAASGVQWLKLPMWTAGNAPVPLGADWMDFLDQLERDRITPVGVLNDPPPQITEKFAGRTVGFGKVLELPKDSWRPAFDLLIARHATQIQHWQLGGDGDHSLRELPDLKQSLADLQAEFSRTGNETRFGFSWNWDEPLPQVWPQTPGQSKGFLSLPAAPQFSEQQLALALQQTSGRGNERWLSLQMLPERGHTLNERLADLASRVVAARRGGAEVIFLAEPVSESHGVLTADGSPTELFIPWRTLALALRGTQYLGSLDLPAQSPNALFVAAERVILVVWNPRGDEEQIREDLFLGEQATAVDLWGHAQPLPTNPRTGTQQIKADVLPKIIMNCVPGIARWRLATRWENDKIPSERGSHQVALQTVNTFPQGVNGTAVLKLPSGWSIEPNRWEFRAGVGEEIRLPGSITIPPGVSLGVYRANLEFEVNAERPYKFEISLPYTLGVGDVVMNISTRVLPDGRLEIEQRIENKTQPLQTLDFECSLFVPGEIRRRQTVTKVGSAPDTRYYYLQDPKKFRGRDLWIRAEEVDGRRVLNQHFQAP